MLLPINAVDHVMMYDCILISLSFVQQFLQEIDLKCGGPSYPILPYLASTTIFVIFQHSEINYNYRGN